MKTCFHDPLRAKMLLPCFRPLLVLMVLAFLPSCAPSLPSDGSLAEGWTFTQASRDEKPPQAKDRVFRAVPDLAALHRLFPSSEDGYLWLKKEFTLPSRLMAKPCALLLGRIKIADETWLNGELVGNEGRFAPDFWNEWNRHRFYPLRPGILREDAPNTLMVKVYVCAEGGILGPVLIDERAQVERLFIFEDFMAVTLIGAIAFLVFMIGCYHVFLFSKRPRGIENLYFGLVCLSFALYLCNQFLTRLPGFTMPSFSYLSFQKIIFSTVNLIAFMNVLFVRKFLRRTERRWIRVSSALLCAIPILAYSFAPDYQSFMALRNLLPLFLVIQLAYTLFMIMGPSLKKAREALILLAGTVPLFLCILYDILVHEILGLHGGIYLSGLGFPAYLLAVAVILANRAVNYHREAEQLNATLEQKVGARTEELKRSNDELESAKSAAESANARLIATNAELEEAQRVARRDMLMAMAVQRSLIPGAPPPNGDWDIASIFMPLSGVSGDIYGFFNDGDSLKGAFLYDVSGHGIAPGLITVIAKSASARRFTGDPGTKLTRIVQEINGDLCDDLANSGNFVSGIMLRFAGETVEYVNAGHPDLLVRRAASGRVRAAASPERETRGHYLGIKREDAAYIGLSFRVLAGDVLFLYSDCLNESMNAGGEQYGAGRIAESLARASGGGAEGMLAVIINDFREFIGERPLNDDLTALLFLRMT